MYAYRSSTLPAAGTSNVCCANYFEGACAGATGASQDANGVYSCPSGGRYACCGECTVSAHLFFLLTYLDKVITLAKLWHAWRSLRFQGHATNAMIHPKYPTILHPGYEGGLMIALIISEQRKLSAAAEQAIAKALFLR